MIKIRDLERLIKEVVEEVREEKSKKTGREKQCSSGNPIHNTDGQFDNASKDRGSWAIGKGGSSATDCAHGQYKRPNASHKKTSDEEPCGRKNRAKKCKGENIKEDAQEEAHDVDAATLKGDKGKKRLDKIVQMIDDLVEEVMEEERQRRTERARRSIQKTR